MIIYIKTMISNMGQTIYLSAMGKKPRKLMMMKKKRGKRKRKKKKKIRVSKVELIPQAVYKN